MLIEGKVGEYRGFVEPGKTYAITFVYQRSHNQFIDVLSVINYSF